MLEVVVLAAGKGTRMNSDLPKVLHQLSGKSFIVHVLDTVEKLTPHAIHLVLGHGKDLVEHHLQGREFNPVLQKEQLGTGHAVLQALPFLDPSSVVLILYGDVPLISLDTLNSLVAAVDSETMALLTVELDNPQGYGRILRDKEHQVTAIVEEKDASTAEKKVTECNTGVMAASASLLMRCLPLLSDNNAQGEYYLTDLVGLSRENNVHIRAIQATNPLEVEGVNNRLQQSALERAYQRNKALCLMEQGVTLIDPQRFDCRGTLQCGQDCRIDVNCIFEGEVILGNQVTIEANCIIKNSSIGDGSTVKAHSMIEDSVVEQMVNVGPYARIRPESILKTKSRVGNFVELKKTILGEGSKVNHLSYVGDAEIGSDVNIGAGTITCNYDGANKFRTIIEDKVFVGSNSALVAPVTLSRCSTVGAGSTITKNVEANTLAVGRQRQQTIANWCRPSKIDK